MRALIIAVALLAFPLAARAEEEKVDTLILVDGTKIEGRILQQAPGQYVIIEVAGEQRTIAWVKIAEVIARTSGAAAPPAAPVPTAPPAPTAPAPVVAPAPGAPAPPTAAPKSEPVDENLAWSRRGGDRLYFAMHGVVTGAIGSSVPTVATQDCTAPEPAHNESPLTYRPAGIGGGLGFRVGYMHLTMPEAGASTWHSFQLGTGADVSALYFLAAEPYVDVLPSGTKGRTCTYTGISSPGIFLTHVAIPFPIGATIGLGRMQSGGVWKGVALGAAYAPTIQIGVVSGGTSSHFNPAAFELTLDVTSLHAEAKSQESHFRLAALVMPPVGDNVVWFLNLTAGAVWY